MLKLKDVSKYYYQDGVVAKGITKVNLELFIGEFVVITGESGSGKSTLLNVLSGLDTYEDGEMYINGEETSHYTEEDYQNYRRRYVSNIFQNFNLVNSYTVYENIELAMLMNGKNRNEVKREVDELINKVGLKKYRNTKTSKLSGGQKQRVAIARALANNTPIIVADEPTGSLDSEASKGILKLLKEISENKLVIVVTHNKKEIEEYATRLIRMHDGKLLENKVINKVNLDSQVVENDVKEITNISKFKLSLKNAFNIPVKFVLMFVIFLLISLTLITNYGSLKMAEFEESETAYNQYFLNSSDKRIVLTKNDKSIFNDNDYNNIKKIDTIDYIVKNDLLNDLELNVYNDYVYMYGKVYLKKIDKVDVGRLPSNDNEIVLIGSKDSYYLTNMKDNIIDKFFTVSDESIEHVKVVGIVYNENMIDGNYEYYLSDILLDKLSNSLYERYSKTSFVLDNNYYTDVFMRIDNTLKDGEVKVKDTLNNICENNSCLNKDIKINVNNIYFTEELNLKITKTYNKNSNNYDEYTDYVYVSQNDYNKLYNKGNYQMSVFLREVKDLEITLKSLHDLGYNTLALRDAKVDEVKELLQIFKIFKLVITVILIITLFFITYFIIKIIYKSRNSYYTTLRSLGGTKKNSISILRNELVILATFTYTLLLITIILVNKNIINIEYFNEISKYISNTDYLIVYLILLLLSILISNRYGRKIFKDSIIKTYGDR